MAVVVEVGNDVRESPVVFLGEEVYCMVQQVVSVLPKWFEEIRPNQSLQSDHYPWRVSTRVYSVYPLFGEESACHHAYSDLGLIFECGCYLWVILVIDVLAYSCMGG